MKTETKSKETVAFCLVYSIFAFLSAISLLTVVVKKKWESNASIQEYIESKQLMRLTALECGDEEIDTAAVRELKPGTVVNLK